MIYKYDSAIDRYLDNLFSPVIMRDDYRFKVVHEKDWYKAVAEEYGNTVLGQAHRNAMANQGSGMGYAGSVLGNGYLQGGLLQGQQGLRNSPSKQWPGSIQQGKPWWQP